jgi:hypothetical protein
MDGKVRCGERRVRDQEKRHLHRQRGIGVSAGAGLAKKVAQNKSKETNPQLDLLLARIYGRKPWSVGDAAGC